MEGGGVYYMISRTLGPEAGAAIGILFFLANVCGSALFAAGFAEGVLHTFDLEGNEHERWILFGFASVPNVVNLIVGLIGPS